MDLSDIAVETFVGVLVLVIGTAFTAFIALFKREAIKTALGTSWGGTISFLRTHWFPRNRKIREMDHEITQQRQRLEELGQQLDQCLTQLKTQQLDLAMAESYRALTGKVSPLLNGTHLSESGLREIQYKDWWSGIGDEDEESLKRLFDTQTRLVRALLDTMNSEDERQQALAMLRELALLLPDSADVQFNLGCVLRMMSKDECAMEAHSEAARLYADDYEAHREYGLAAMFMNEGSRAFQAFCHCWRLRPDGDHLLGNLFSAANSLQTPQSLRAAFEFLARFLDQNEELQKRIRADPSQFEPLYDMINKLEEVDEVRTQRRVREIPALVTLTEYFIDRDAASP